MSAKGTASEVEICGRTIRLGDYVVVEYTTGEQFRGGRIRGKVVELWDGEHLQGRVESGWCFHDEDRILVHKPAAQPHVQATAANAAGESGSESK